AGGSSQALAGEDFSVALTAGGEVWVWGTERYGFFSPPAAVVDPPPPPRRLGALAGIVAVAAGEGHLLALRDDGALFGLGENGRGRLGDGTNIARTRPSRVVTLGEPLAAQAVAAGSWASLAVRPGGTLAAFGDLSPDVANSLAGVTSAAAGERHYLAVAGGAVWAWGQNEFGQLGDGTTGDADTPVPVQGLPANVAAVAAGSFHSLALTEAGEVWAWGANGQFQVAPAVADDRPLPLRVAGLPGRVVAVAGGGTVSLAVLETGELYAWGLDFAVAGGPVQVGGLPALSAVSAAGGSVLVLAQNDGGVWTVAGSVAGAVVAQVPVVVGAAALTAGPNHSLAALADGTVLAWGRNFDGQLGDGTRQVEGPPRAVPEAVVDLTGVVAVAAGDNRTSPVGGFSLALTADGEVWGWGANLVNQLGNGTPGFHRVPARVREVVPFRPDLPIPQPAPGGE
ncbi:MAG: RCC1 domain-containing protein, partial [Deferrisomatales bacterium]